MDTDFDFDCYDTLVSMIPRLLKCKNDIESGLHFIDNYEDFKLVAHRLKSIANTLKKANDWLATHPKECSMD